MRKVLIVDDHALVRAGIRQLLQDEASIGLVGEAASGPDALEAALSGAWDLVVLDVTLPGRSGVEVLRELRRRRPQLPVIMISFYLDSDYIKQCLAAGAAGYVAKESLPEDLAQAVRQVLDGKGYVSSAVSAAIEPAPPPPPATSSADEP